MTTLTTSELSQITITAAERMQQHGIACTPEELAEATTVRTQERLVASLDDESQPFPREFLQAFLDVADAARLDPDAFSCGGDIDSVTDDLACLLRRLNVDFDPVAVDAELADLEIEEFHDLDNWLAEAFRITDADGNLELVTEHTPSELDWLDAMIGFKSNGSSQPRAETRIEAEERLKSELHRGLSDLTECQADHDEKSAAAKAAKKQVETSQLTLNRIVRELDEVVNDGNWQPCLPFAPPEDDESQGDQSATAITKDPALTAPISDLGLTEATNDKLVAADIDTVSELEQIINQDRLRKVKGVGDSAIDKISDAVMAWREVHGYGKEAESDD